jgi:hypothetical protein
MLQYLRQLDNGLRGITGEEPGILNKITGCESRTVPPLYVRVARALTKVSHWIFPGRLPLPPFLPEGQRMSQKTYATLSFPTSRGFTGWCVCRRKTAAALFRAPQYSFLWRETYENQKNLSLPACRYDSDERSAPDRL